MIKFYESIPSYEEVRDLPDFDFTERVSLLKKIHCDLSQPLVHRIQSPQAPKSVASCRKKTSAKKKRDSPLRPYTISPSLCRSFSKTSLNDLGEIDSGKQKCTGRMRSADSNSVPTPLRRLQLLREKLSATVNDHQFKNEKLRRYSPMCSPIFSDMKSPHFQDLESHPCDLYFNHCHSSYGMDYKFPVSFRDTLSPPKSALDVDYHHKEWKPDIIVTSPPPIDVMKRRRAQSCPKELFGTTKACLNFQTEDDKMDSSSNKQQPSESTPTCNPDCSSSASSRPRNKMKNVSKAKTKTPSSMDEFLSSKMVRSNLAANLRQKWSRKRINEMTEEKMKATMTVSKCIPKCHRWNVRSTPAWKSFTSEDLQTEKRLREEARREEKRMRQHAHTMTMNIMRAKVESAQLLLEGRALSAKS